MATKDERPGFMSKMAMFVRNPTKDWSELDQLDQPQESGYDKQALKAMIERKRQNDFVRRREFDQLRKLRNRDPGAVAAASARPSFFQTSLPTDADGRAVTLKKIDEIEAQMSKQWWKGKQEAAARGENFPVQQTSVQVAGETGKATLGPVVSQQHFEPTQTSELHSVPGQADGTDFAATEMGTGMAPMEGQPRSGRERSYTAMPPVGALAQSYDSSDVGFSTSKLFAIEAEEMATDPELEEAAIRFANGDDTGAESGLLAALRSSVAAPDTALSWAAALFDLYRATNKRDAFDRAMEEFGGRFENLVPVWSAIGDEAAVGKSPASASSAAVVGRTSTVNVAQWSSPAILTLSAMEDLREVMSRQAMPWHLDWTLLQQVTVDAMPLLGGLFSSLCDEPVSLRFSGTDSLVQTLRGLTPSGDRSIDMAWWVARLNVLRAICFQDEFELAALDYCVTFEVSPPAWQDARCQCELVGSGQSSATEGGVNPGGDATAPMGLDDSGAPMVELRGEVLGDATQFLAVANGSSQGDHIVVSCSSLLRVDFSAAGSILNWVAVRQAEGRHVQFRDVHRLVAAFFNVIGINEHARVVPRPM